MFFTRHMRILERCVTSWPMPELKAQIDALREAFSADINRPFELKPSFPYGSPSDPYHPSPPPFDSGYQSASYASVTGPPPNALNFNGVPITPPMSLSQNDKTQTPPLQTMGFMQSHPADPSLLNVPLVDGNSWDPTRIMT